MTSRKSSKIKHNSPYAFKSSFSSGAFPAVLYTVFMLAVFPIQNAVKLLDEKSLMARNTSEKAVSALSGSYMYSETDSYTSLAQKYIYSLFDGGEELMLFVALATVGVSILMGISLFRFITSKKTVNVYYSLGIKRTNLFISRFTSGLVLLFVCIALPLILSATISAVLIGFNSQLVLATFYTVLCIFSLAAIAYSVTSAVFSAVGTSFEGAGFSLGILAVPSVFFLCIEIFAANLLYGNPIDAGYFQLGKTFRYENISMINKYGLFNPLLYLSKLFSADYISYGQLSQTAAAELKASGIDFASDMKFIVPVAWLTVAVVALLIGIVVFNRRRAEICGFIGMSKVFNFTMSFIIGFAALTFIVAIIPEDRFALAVASGFLAMVLIYFIFNLIIIRSPKKVFKTSYLLGAQILTAGIILSVFAFGGFGYSSKIPKAEDVDSVYITPVTVDSILSGDNCYIDSYLLADAEGNEPVYLNSLSPSTLGPYTSKDDINHTLKLHSKLIELGSCDLDSEKYYNAQIVIYYTLKNGKTLVRCYDKADIEVLHMCIDFYNSDFYDENLEESFFGSDTQAIDESVDYNYSRAIAVNAAMTTDSFKYLDLTPEQFDGLKQAIVNDLKDLSSQQFYTPEKPAVGAIIFAPISWLGADYTYYDDGDASQVRLVEESEICNRVYGTSMCNIQKTVFLTQDMTQTLTFLKANNLMGYFSAVKTEDVESISFRPAVISRDEWPYVGDNDVTLNFYAKNRTVEEKQNGTYTKTPVGERLIDQNRIVNQAQIAQVLSKAHMHYYTDNNGFVCYITYTNGETVEKYLPLEDAPDFVKNYTYKLSTLEGEEYFYSYTY